jgi:hypothetical protein
MTGRRVLRKNKKIAQIQNSLLTNWFILDKLGLSEVNQRGEAL